MSSTNWSELAEQATTDPTLVPKIALTFAAEIQRLLALDDRVMEQDLAIVPHLSKPGDKMSPLVRQIAFALTPPDDISSSDDRKFSYAAYGMARSVLRAKCTMFELARERERKNKDDEEKKFKLARGAGEPAQRLWCTLKKAPLSDKVVDPTPMPVDVAPLEELQPFFQYLKTSVALPGVDHIAFKRGAVYADGRIDLCKQVVGPNWIQRLMDSIRNNPNIKHFLLGNNIIDVEGAKAIAEFIASPQKEEGKHTVGGEEGKRAPKIETWYLAGNRIDGEGCEYLATALVTDKNANALWLKRNPLKARGARALANMLAQDTCNLTILDLTNTGLLDEGATYLFEALKSNKTLRHLYMDANGIAEVGAKAIASYLCANGKEERKDESKKERKDEAKGEHGEETKVTKSDCHLESLWLDTNRLGDEGICILSKSLEVNTSLRRLALGSNRIGPNGMKMLCESLAKHPSLTMLDVAMYKSTADLGELTNRVGDEGAVHLAQLMRLSPQLRIVNISHNGLSDKGLAMIRDALYTAECKKIMQFEYREYDVKFEGSIRADIAKALEYNTQEALGICHQEYAKTRLRFEKHTDKIRHIDSIYRNKKKL